MIHEHLLSNPDFNEGLANLLTNKPKERAFTKAAEELVELATKLLQYVNKGQSEGIEEELVDVQMHLLLLQSYFDPFDLAALSEQKTIKMLQSNDYKNYCQP